MPQPVSLDPYDRKRLALDAEVDYRTFDRAMAGKPVQPSSLRRIRRALAAASLAHLLPAQGRSPA